jgi:hypothetical protein
MQLIPLTKGYFAKIDDADCPRHGTELPEKKWENLQ